MSNEKSNKVLKWSMIVSMVTIIYAVLYGLKYLRPAENIPFITRINNITIIVLMFIGAIGLYARRIWGVKMLVFGSWLAVLRVVYTLFLIIDGMGGAPPAFFLLGVLTAMLPIVGWPVFLLIWLSRNKIPSQIADVESLSENIKELD